MHNIEPEHSDLKLIKYFKQICLTSGVSMYNIFIVFMKNEVLVMVLCWLVKG